MSVKVSKCLTHDMPANQSCKNGFIKALVIEYEIATVIERNYTHSGAGFCLQGLVLREVNGHSQEGPHHTRGGLIHSLSHCRNYGLGIYIQMYEHNTGEYNT